MTGLKRTQYGCPDCTNGKAIGFPGIEGRHGHIGKCPTCEGTGSVGHRYVRRPWKDRRIGRGDDFAGDCWLDLETHQVRYVAVDHNPNLARDAS